jgi:lipopolysaccharide export system permease protein
MLTTFDRFLLRQYLLAFAILFATALGLFAVVDGFTNLDAFQQASRNDGLAMMLWRMGERYFYQSSMVFDMATPFLAILSMLVVLTLLIKNGELHPLLAAGIPSYRVCLPLLLGVIGVNGLLAANQEWLLPRVAPYLHGSHGEGSDAALSVQPKVDAQGIYIAGKELFLHDQSLADAEFRLPYPQLARDYTTILARRAVFLPATDELSAGWIIDEADLTSPIDPSQLTDAGRECVLWGETSRKVLIKTDVTIDQLASSVAGHRYISTSELLRRLRSPTGSIMAARAQVMHFHWRLTRVLVNVIGFFVLVPFLIRREHDGLAANIATSMLALSVVYALVVGGYYLGEMGFLQPEAAVWAPLILGGGYCAWIASWVRT